MSSRSIAHLGWFGAALVGPALGLVVGLVSCGSRRPLSIETPVTTSVSASAEAAGSAGPAKAVALAVNDSPFLPSFTRLDPRSIQVDASVLGSTVQCASCHADVDAQFDGSAHRGSSFHNRFYAASVGLTRKDRGNVTSRWCAGCHDPSLLLDGVLLDGTSHNAPIADGKLLIDGNIKTDTKASFRAGDGVGCLVCHSQSAASRLGGGGYTLLYQGFSPPDRTEPSIAAHKRAMRPAHLSEPEMCASCHKVSLHKDVNGKRWYRGQNDFDAWEQGPYALGGGKSAGPIYAPDVEAKTCQQCHMPHEAAEKDRSKHVLDESAAKKSGLPVGSTAVRSHRFLAANTGLAAYTKDPAEAAAWIAKQATFLKGSVRVEVAAIRRAAAFSTALSPETTALIPGEHVSLDVVVENTRVGHRFPTGTADSNEIWLAIELLDADGRVIQDSGSLDARGELLPEAHRFSVLQLDGTGLPALARDAHRFAALGWDNTIAPRDTRVIRYAVDVPTGVKLPVSARARVRYRKFTLAFSELACRTTETSAPMLPASTPCPKLAITDIDEDRVTFGTARPSAGAETWKRLDAYARGLLNAVQEDVGVADGILADVIKLAPTRAEGFVDFARLRIREGRTADAYAYLDAAAKLDPTTPVIPYLRGLAKYEVYKLGEALEPLQLATDRAPRNLLVRELFAEALQLRGNYRQALDVIGAGLRIDPEGAQLRHLEALALEHLGFPSEADIARKGYLEYRRDDDTPRLRGTCKAKVPGCALEAVPLHEHGMTVR